MFFPLLLLTFSHLLHLIGKTSFYKFIPHTFAYVGFFLYLCAQNRALTHNSYEIVKAKYSKKK